ncbi:sorting and assembly machinery component 50 homolog B-like [Cynara cardunculus var. scolymus]|uniref:Bacterial surface antigen (D15) n=1 Tax=Cynara cardunculus var. scolymus TaxID=59895 RepID=A0A103Y998_CYNCS|nr:sorting and assembly machinery component 50 homolog B-like [Cynara cardunculus var. scolymus]KVI04840.1 Bacterial surface antigen (D15) [Cynara cardunculus var. scolymus]
MVKEDNPISQVDEDEDEKESSNGGEEEEEDDFDEDEDEDEDEEEEEQQLPVTSESRMRAERARMEGIFHRISSERVPLRVHDVLIKGNNKTKESLIEAEVEALKNATSVQELLQAATIANARLQKLDIFDSVNITLDSGPPELPGTSNVIVQVVESKNPLTGDIGIFTKPEAKSWSLEGSLKLKNLFGYGDLWDGSLSYGWDQTSEVSAGVSLPRFMRLLTPVMARVSLLSQDWLKFSSYKEQALGLSLGLLSTKNHDLAYNISWRTLTDPSQMASKSIRRQLGHGLLSHLKYTFKIDRRNSSLRPTRGFAFVSTSQLGGIFPDYRSLRFIRQEVDLRYALPLGFAGAALNFGVAGGVLFPWGNGFLNTPASLPDRFFLGGNSSPVCTLGGPTSLLGFKTRGLGPSEPKRQVKTNSEDTNSDTSERDFLGGDLAVTAFADLSFDLPLKVLRDSNIHAHAFACAGSLTKLTENAFQDFSFQKYRDSFRSSAGFGLIVPTKLFRMEVNYCYIVRQHEEDRAKTGVQFSFSSPL